MTQFWAGCYEDGFREDSDFDIYDNFLDAKHGLASDMSWVAGEVEENDPEAAERLYGASEEMRLWDGPQTVDVDGWVYEIVEVTDDTYDGWCD